MNSIGCRNLDGISCSSNMCKHTTYRVICFPCTNSTKNIDFYFIYFPTHTPDISDAEENRECDAHICAAYIESNSLSDVWYWNMLKAINERRFNCRVQKVLVRFKLKLFARFNSTEKCATTKIFC